MKDERIMFLLISKTCLMLQAQVFLQSLPPTTVPAAFLSCNYMVKLQSQGHVCSAKPFQLWKPQWVPQGSLQGQPIAVWSSVSGSFVFHKKGEIQGTPQMLRAGTMAATGAGWQEWPSSHSRAHPLGKAAFVLLWPQCQTWWLSNHFLSYFLQ